MRETKKETIQIHRMYRSSGDVRREESEEQMIDVRTKPANVEMATVSFGARATINTGNYESIQISVDVTVPCFAEELSDAYEHAKKFVNDRLKREASDVRDYRKNRGA